MSSELDRLGWLIKRAQHRHHRALDVNLAPLGITLVQWNALREIDRHPGCSQLGLANTTFNSAQSFGALVARLIASGWVVRRQGAGRATIHELTADGRSLLREGQGVMTAVLTASFAPLDKHERVELARLLDKLAPLE